MLSHVDFYSYYGNDFGNFLNYTFDQCRDLCLAACDCIAFEYNFNKEAGYSKCYPKTRLLNGYRSPELNGDVYLKLPKSYILSHNNPLEEFNLNCSGDGTLPSGKKSTEKFMLWFACGVGGLEIISFFLAWFLLIKTQKSLGVDKQEYDRAAIGFRKFTYTELKKATKSFKIIDPMLEGKYDIFEMKALVQVALQCVEEDKDVRPTMSQVVEMLLLEEKVSDGVTYNECNLMAY
ncbi:putative receptor protein kinase zmpk1 [Quercus suber]|uniref:Receptor protein kinase zmpk1 n=1 Tax=Quercus suber TaxID=58331 RepID=A0AAW0KQJ8_QUESU